MVEETILALNLLGGRCQVRLAWEKAHRGTEGNERADDLAKAGCLLPLGEAFPSLVPKTEIKTRIHTMIRDKWQQQWDAYPHARQSKQFFSKINKSRAQHIYKLSRAKLARLIRITTGHNNLNYHRSLINPDRENGCRFCGEEAETFFHLVTDCPAFRL